MWKSEVSLDVAAPAEHGLRDLADFTRHSEWSLSKACSASR